MPFWVTLVFILPHRVVAKPRLSLSIVLGPYLPLFLRFQHMAVTFHMLLTKWGLEVSS